MSEDHDASKNLQHRVDRVVIAHSELLFVARGALSQGRSGGGKSDYMVALVMTAFAFEAFLNYLGEALASFWPAIEKIPVKSKLSVICDILEYQPEHGNRPYQTLEELRKFRNSIAHVRSEELSETKEWDREIPISYPQTSWESKCNDATVTRIMNDVEKVMHDLHERSGIRRGGIGDLGSRGGEILG